MKNKQVYVATFCTKTSIGSMLQAYGLKYALKELGYKSSVICKRSDNYQPTAKPKTIKAAAKFIFNLFIKEQVQQRDRKRLHFIDSYMDMEYFEEYSQLKKYQNVDTDSTVFLAGSDQIWNPVNCDPLFFLEFAAGHRCVSYAASMGNTQISVEKQAFFSNHLERFAHISVREQDAKTVLMQYTDKEICVHIDPVFLVEQSAWRAIEQPYRGITEKYILMYMLYWDESVREEVKTLKEQTGLPVYAVTSGLSRVYADKRFYDVGVEEFLWLIDHAEYVITSSFHGAAFATIFHKKYAPIINPNLPSRLTNLLETLSVPIVAPHNLCTSEAFDYEQIDRRICEEREKGLHYLERTVSE